MRIIVTGASSYISRYIIDMILIEGHEVLGISRTKPSIEHPRFFFKECNLVENIPIVDGKWDIIIHMAAHSLLNEKASEYFNVNLLLTNNIRKLALRVLPDVILYASSFKVYGEIRDKVLTENSDRINSCLYGTTKYYGEQLLQEVAPTVSLRMPGVLGKGSHGWIDKIHKSLLINEKITLSSSAYNHIVHAYDVATVFIKIIAKKYYEDEQYNICSSGISTSLEVVEFMKKELGSDSEIVVSDNTDNGFIFSNKKLCSIHSPMTVLDSIKLYLSEF